VFFNYVNKIKITVVLFMVFGFAILLQAQTTKDDTRLKKSQKRFPAADINKDGVLSKAEINAFKEKNAGKQNRDKAKAKPARIPEGGQRYIYKKIDKDKVELPLYLYKPAKQKAGAKTPAIVFFHGGTRKSSAPTQFEHHCKYLASRGMVAITVVYRVTSLYDIKIEDCIEDAKSAMRWVRENAKTLGVDPNRIASGGGSAGGHLAACTSVVGDFDSASDNLKVSAKPNAMVLFNPVMALAPDERLSKPFSGSGRTHGPAKKVSPLTYATTKQPPCVMFFGTEDWILEGAELYRKDSVKAGNVCKIVTYQGQKHSFFNHGKSGSKYYNLTVAEMDKFLVELGWLPPKERL